MTNPQDRNTQTPKELLKSAVGSAVVEESSQNMVAELMESAQGRRALSIQSPVFFDTHYCGMRYAPHRERWLDIFEECIETAKRTSRKRKLLLLAPRDHGKTEACITLAVKTLCQNRNARILWICESEGQAKKRLRRVRALMNSRIIRDDWTTAPDEGYGPWIVTDEDKWSDKEVYINRSIASVDPSLEAVGAGGAVTGGHFDLIVCDDLEDDKTVYSANNRKKTRDWFKGTVNPMLVTTGAMVVVGTRKHHDDLYGHFIKDPTFEIIEDKAIKVWPETFDYVYEEKRGKKVAVDITYTGNPEHLWDERPLAHLLLERLAVGPLLFSREFQNEVQDDSAAPFKWDHLQAAKLKGKHLSYYDIPDIKGLDMVQGWDFALVQDAERAESRDTDYTVGLSWAKDYDANRYLVGFKRKRGITEGQLKTLIKSEFRLLEVALHQAKVQFMNKDREHAPPTRPRAVSVERNNFGELHFLGLQRTTDLPLKPHQTTAGKADPWEGVPSLAMLFENGKVVLPSKTHEDEQLTDTLIAELWGLGREKHDDCPMALWIAEMQLRKDTFVHSIAFGDDDSQTMSAESDERMLQEDLLDDPLLEDVRAAHRELNRPERRERDPGEHEAPEVWAGLNLGAWD